MQDEVNEKTISLCVQCTRMTAGVLKAALRKYLNDRDRAKQNKVQGERKNKRTEASAEESASWETDNETVDGKRHPAVKHSDNGPEYPFV